MLDTSVVHLDPAAQIVNLGHDIDVPVDVRRRARCLGIPSVVPEKPFALHQRSLVVANNL